jgi:hypothetical protein
MLMAPGFESVDVANDMDTIPTSIQGILSITAAFGPLAGHHSTLTVE